MASAEMPGVPMKAATSTSPPKKQDHMASTPASEKHMVAGRRKLDEFRKKRALKNKAAEKAVLSDVHLEGLANGPNLGLISSGQSGVNGQDTEPVSHLKEERRESSFQGLQLEQASDGEFQETTSITKDSVQGVSSSSGYIPTSAAIVSSQLEGDSVIEILEENSNNRLLKSKISSQNFSGITGSDHKPLSWIEGIQEGKNRASSKALENNTLGYASGDSYDSPMFNRKESTEVFSNGPLPSRTSVDSWKRPTETMRRGFSHESFPMLRHESDSDTAVLSLASFTKDGIADSKREELHRQSRISNGRREWNPKETQPSMSQPKKLLFSERTEREPLFTTRVLDKTPFQALSTNITASPAIPPSIGHQEGPSLSLSASDHSTADIISDKKRESKTDNQQEAEQKHADNDDFAALEQHIHDLTQEKFTLQRALEAARSLADSLSQQNSALTEDFNSQGAIINQLQDDLEKKNEEVTAQSLVLSSLMMERERAQQENNSAVERSQILAGEVIGLEEKVLRLRSSELKLQKELENLKTNNDSFRVQLTTLDKDRQNLRTMLEALHEDKKLLQSQLQKAFAGRDSSNTRNANEGLQRDSRDASTSTEDLVLQIQNTHTLFPVVKTRDDAGEATSSSKVVSTLDFIGVGVPSTFATLSSDDFRAIDSIDNLITKLFSEKETLLESLRRESARATEFEALNDELSKKLETQTQRLELAVAQNMAYGGNAVTANSIEIEPQYSDYVDEGDEVVERVLGWIMRIFPGGSSRRQSRKLL